LVIEVDLHTILQKQTLSGYVRKLDVELPPGSSLADLLLLLDISIDPELLLFVINGKLADINTEIMDHDIINLIPAISGG
jgi:molybdopterin converting factor small subunit